MKQCRLGSILLALACLSREASVARAQQSGLPVPRLLSVTPTSLAPGGSAEILLSGQDLDEPQGLLFSHPGIKAEMLPAPPAAGKKPPTGPPPLLFKIQVPAQTPLGWLDLRLVNKWGVSNPLPVQITKIPEMAEQEPNNDVSQAQRLPFNVTVNGVIAAGSDVDYFVFTGIKGQNVVVRCLATSIGSPLDAAVELYAASGKRLAASHHYRGGDAVLSHRLPHDGDYFVRVHNFAYLPGSAKHSYQLTVSTAPWLDAVFPPMVEPGRPNKLTLLGRNLPGGKVDPTLSLDGAALEKVEVTLNVPAQPELFQSPLPLNPAVFVPADLEWIEYALDGAAGPSVSHLLGLAKAPVVRASGDNHSPQHAQEVSLPCEIAGRFAGPREQHWYSFTARKGDIWEIDLLAERIGSPVDLFFVLRDARFEKVLTQQDDKAPSVDPPRYQFVVPADGTYQLMIGSHASAAPVDPRQVYRLTLRREQPGYKLLAVHPPGVGTMRQGSSETLQVLITRWGDWNGDIKLTAENLPPGVACPPQTVGPNVKQALLVFTAATDAPLWTGAVRIKGSAQIGGKTVTQLAQGATSPTAYTRNIVLAVRDSGPFTLSAAADKTMLLQGDVVKLSIAAIKRWEDVKTPVQLSGLNLPAGISLAGKPPVLTLADKAAQGEVTLLCKADMQPGTYTVLLQGQTQVPFSKTPSAKPANVAVKLASTPLTITVLPSKVATPTVTPPTPSVKIGKETEIVVKVKRLYDYSGPIKIQLVIPDSIKGLAGQEAIIPAGMDQVKLVLKADPTISAGPRPGLVVRLVAALPQGFQATQEVKLTVNVVK